MIAPEMVTIPSGSFKMGCVADDKFSNTHELPRHDVEVAAFELARHPAADDRGMPLVNVSWLDVMELCGDNYRLPTEAEWEYACRAGTSSVFPSGDLPDPKKVNYLYDELGNRRGPGKLMSIGWGEPNQFGLHDMLGNVCEWVADDWRTNYVSEPGNNELKVIRGGAWDYLPRLLRPSWRDFSHAGTRRDNLGFRLARDLT